MIFRCAFFLGIWVLCFFFWDLCFEKKVIVSFWIGGLLKQLSILKIVSDYGEGLVAWLVSHDWVVE